LQEASPSLVFAIPGSGWEPPGHRRGDEPDRTRPSQLGRGGPCPARALSARTGPAQCAPPVPWSRDLRLASLPDLPIVTKGPIEETRRLVTICRRPWWNCRP